MPSSRFHLFLPVGFLTAEQKANGYSGSAIGIHGPHAGFAWLGHFTASVDWTQGCIALGANAEIEQVAKWVRGHPGVEVLLLQ